jgi:GrpB-like predicted nucleotidyltransferase (UPF0157 family)
MCCNHWSDLVIAPYSVQPPACLEYDPRSAEVAHRIAQRITSLLPGVTVEHIGSTAVQGCAGKGIVDLMVLYPEGRLEQVKLTLDELGFQRQTAGHLFPETRPMRVGSVPHRGCFFRAHLHVIAAHSPEAAALRAFRERLRADDQIAAAYVAEKQAILAAGVTDCKSYTGMKGRFVKLVLAAPDVMSPE